MNTVKARIVKNDEIIADNVSVNLRSSQGEGENLLRAPNTMV